MSPSRVAALGQRRVVFSAAVVIGAFVLFFPARHLVEQRARIDALSERRLALRAENHRLAEEAGRLSDPSELEVLARDRLGLVKPGERAYFIEPSGSPALRAEVREERSVWSRAWAWLTELVKGRS